MGKISKETKTLLAFLAVCVLWGTTYLAIRIGVKDFPPGLFAGLRFLVAGILVLILARAKGLNFPDNIKDIGKLSLVGLFLLFGGVGLVVWAQQWVHAGIASLIIAVIPLYMAIIELILPNRESLRLRGWLGLLIGFAGVILLVSSHTDAGTVNLTGVIALLIAALSWSIGSVYSKTFQPSGTLFTNIGVQMLAGGFALTMVGLLRGEIALLKFTVPGVLSLLYLIFFGSIVGYGCYIYVLQEWPASKAGMYSYVNPLVAILFGALLLKEPVNLFVILSAFLILSGVFIVQTAKHKKNIDIGLKVKGG